MKDFTNSALSLLKDIRFWIFFFLLLHLSTITLPPYEPGSTWRQTDGLMIARNFYERNPNIMYPMVDLAGEKSGIVGCEFPILNYLIYLLSLIFGFESWFGRIINLIVSSFGIFFLYKLIKSYFGESTAFNTVIIVLVSIWFTYTRTNIPDTFAASLCIIGLYFGVFYLENGKTYRLLLFFIFSLLGCLSKISAASLLTVLAVPILLRKDFFFRKLALSSIALVIFLSVCSWYFIWVPHLNTKYGIGGHFFMGMTMLEGAKQLFNNWPATLNRFYETSFKFTGFVAFLIGLFLVIKNRLWLELVVFAIPFFAFFTIIIKTGENFIVDAYYVIMFIPPMAFIVGRGLSQIERPKIVAAILLVVGIEGVANQIHVFQIRQPSKSLETLETALDIVTQRNDLIAISGFGPDDPTCMYAAHRRGWVANHQMLLDTSFLNHLKSNGCKFVVVVKSLHGDINLDLKKIYNSDYFSIYKISN